MVYRNGNSGDGKRITRDYKTSDHTIMHYITKSRRLNGETRAHIVNIVRLSSSVQYRLDVAFGGDGPTSPLLLISGQVTKNLGSQELRLIYDNILKQTRKEQKVWIYHYRNAADKLWNSYYSFAELEFCSA